MDNRPDTKKDVEYVEAEPIGPETRPAPQTPPQAQTYYHTSSGCVPCCGPVGCAGILLIVLLIFGNSDLARPLFFALIIFITVSAVGRLLIVRR